MNRYLLWSTLAHQPLVQAGGRSWLGVGSIIAFAAALLASAPSSKMTDPTAPWTLVRPASAIKLALPNGLKGFKRLKRHKDIFSSASLRSSLASYKEELNYYYWNLPEERRKQQTLPLLELKQAALEEEAKVFSWRERLFGISGMSNDRLKVMMELIRVKDRRYRLEHVKPSKDMSGLDLSDYDVLFDKPPVMQKSSLRLALESLLVGLVFPVSVALGSVARGEVPEFEGYFKTAVLSTAVVPVQVMALLKFKGWYDRRYESIAALSARFPFVPEELPGDKGQGGAKAPGESGGPDGAGPTGAASK